MHTLAILPFRIGDIVAHPTLDWSKGLKILGLTLGTNGLWSASVTDIDGGGFWQFPAHELVPDCLSNGTRVVVSNDRVITTLPNGKVVHAAPERRSAEMARRLGYGEDVAALTRDHDPLHARLTDWLGMPFSYSLMQAAGCDVDPKLAAIEEDAVLAVQKLKRAWEKEVLP